MVLGRANRASRAIIMYTSKSLYMVLEWILIILLKSESHLLIMAFLLQHQMQLNFKSHSMASEIVIPSNRVDEIQV